MKAYKSIYQLLIMKKGIFLVLIIVLPIIALAAVAGYNKGYRLPFGGELPSLDKEEISKAINADWGDVSILVSFSMRSPVYQYRGYIFKDRTFILREIVNGSPQKEALQELEQEGSLSDLSQELITIINEAPDEHYQSTREVTLPVEEFKQLLQLFADGEIYIKKPGVQHSETGISYGFSLYIENKLASYQGDLLSGHNGEWPSPLEGVNEEIFLYLTDVLFPYAREYGPEITLTEYNEKKGEKLEDYPFVLVYDRGNPDKIIGGDLSLWESE